MKARQDSMKTYYIYNQYTDEYIGELKANSILDAEIKTWETFGIGTDDVYALSTAPNEALA